MSTMIVRRQSSPPPMLPSLRGKARQLLAAAFAMIAATVACAQSTATFTLQDKTNLPAGTYQIYVTGFSTAGPYVLQADGSWGTPAAPVSPSTTATLPCYRFPQDITQVQINGTQTSISARVYYFIVTDKTLFSQCTPTTGNSGLFSVAGAFTYTNAATLNLSEPSTTLVSGMTFPAWTYSEIGANSANGTIDLSQVDFYAFPMSTTATVLSATPANPSAIGNPVGSTANPGEAVNQVSIRDSYRKFINALAASSNNNKSCADDSTPTVCAYLDLLQDIRTAGSSAPQYTQYVIQNPGGYLAQYTSTTQTSRLNTVFDGVIGTLWSTTNAPTLVINTGGALGNVPQDTFTSSIVTNYIYPGSSPPYPVTAMKFTGTATSGSYVAYIVSPADYQAGCAVTTIQPVPPIANCVNASSTGYQVFAGAGVFGTPTYGTSDYQQVAARLGFLISGAMNRGVALAQCASATWQCWQDETYWYPTAVSTMFPNITQNLFSRWMHTATIGGTPMFMQPPNPMNSASSTANTGKPQGMAYGFSNDENPTPTVPKPPALTSPQSEVPSKFDGTVVYGSGSSYTITFGPWVTQPSPNPTLSVTTQGTGIVTSSPAGINCGSTCSQSYAAGTTVVLTAVPGRSWVFGGWSGPCTGRSLTCTVTVNGTTTVTAAFWAIAAAPPVAYGLHAMVTGNGTVTSAPAGIVCGSECSKAFNANTSVTLSAVAGAGSVFAGWSGACSGTSATCTVAMSDAQTVGASFVAGAQYTLSVTSGAGGIVTTVPGAIDCGTRCIAGFAAGTPVNVIARPNPGYRFVGWSGACSGANTCDLTMNANTAVQAAFAPVVAGQFALTVHDFGEGVIASLPGGINCGTSCSAAFASGAKITLVATAAAGYKFVGWSGACSGADACVVWMDDLADVNAFFAPLAIVSPPPLVTEPIPTLAEWAMMLMGLLILAVGCTQPRTRARKTK